jgi:hypothetical protein
MLALMFCCATHNKSRPARRYIVAVCRNTGLLSIAPQHDASANFDRADADFARSSEVFCRIGRMAQPPRPAMRPTVK